MKIFTFYKLSSVLVAALLLVSFLPGKVQGQTKTFTGTGNFSDATKWTGGTVPVAGDNLIIDGACTVDDNIGTDGIAYGTLTIGTATGSTLNWAAAGTNQLNVFNINAGAASTLDMTNGGTLIIRGTWTSNNLTFTPGAGTIEVQSSTSLPAYATYNNLAINGAGNTVTLIAATTLTGDLTISAGTFSIDSFTANRASAGGTFTLSGTAALQIRGPFGVFPANFSTHSISATSTVEYAQGTLIVAVLNSAQSYGNLITSGGGNKTLAGNVDVAGDLTIISPSTLSLSNYALNRTAAGGTLTATNGATLLIGGNNTMPSNFATYAFGANSNVQYIGSIQSVALLNGASYGNLLINGIGTATLAGNVGVAGNLGCVGGIFDIGNYTINRTSAGGTLTIYSTLKIGGTNTIPANYSTHDVIFSSTIEYYGSNQTIAVLNSAQNYGNLTVSGSATKTLAGNVTVDGTLFFDGATITTGADTLYSTSGVSRNSGHVVGNFKIYIGIGTTSRTFEIGDAINYTPATIAFAGLTTAGDLTASVAIGDHANIGSSAINPGKTANRNWTLTNSGTVFTTYNATFTFVVGDLDAGAIPGNFIVGKYSAGWTYPTVGIKTATTTEATGLTAFSDFQLGQVSTLPVTYISIKAIPKNAAIQIDWQVAEESGIQKYEIERSVEGMHFSKAGEVAAKGNNSSESYQWLDVHPLTGNNYYRVRAIEADVKFFLSKIVVAKMNADKPFINVFPNPVKKQQINIRVDEMTKGTYRLNLYNPQGQQILQQMIDHPGGSFNEIIYLIKKLPGMFYLQIANEKQKHGQVIFIE